jgi:hypothetical protein
LIASLQYLSASSISRAHLRRDTLVAGIRQKVAWNASANRCRNRALS